MNLFHHKISGRLWIRQKAGRRQENLDILWHPGIRCARDHPEQGPRPFGWLLGHGHLHLRVALGQVGFFKIYWKRNYTIKHKKNFIILLPISQAAFPSQRSDENVYVDPERRRRPGHTQQTDWQDGHGSGEETLPRQPGRTSGLPGWRSGWCQEKSVWDCAAFQCFSVDLNLEIILCFIFLLEHYKFKSGFLVTYVIK